MPKTILVVDDSECSRDLIRDALLRADLFCRCQTASDGLEGFKALTEATVDLVVLDLQMPRVDGIRFLQMVHARPELRNIPVIMLTASHDRQTKLQGLGHGAIDFLTKPFDADELVARVKNHLKVKKFQDELKAASEHFKELSNLDPLTNLYNRRFLTHILEKEVQRALRFRSPLCLMIMDIDHFKDINDSYGHQGGDKVLVTVAEALRNVLRPYDFASRYGGEEFVLIIPGASPSHGEALAERLRKTMEALSFDGALRRARVTASVGVTFFEPSDEEAGDVEALLRQADAALYRAKRNGRNRVETAKAKGSATCS